MSLWIFPLGMIVLVFIFCLMSWGQHRNLLKARLRVEEWRDIALRSHETNMQMKKDLTTYVTSLQKMSIPDQIIVGNMRLEQYALKIEEHNQEIVIQRTHDTMRGYANVEMD